MLGRARERHRKRTGAALAAQVRATIPLGTLNRETSAGVILASGTAPKGEVVLEYRV